MSGMGWGWHVCQDRLEYRQQLPAVCSQLWRAAQGTKLGQEGHKEMVW